MSVVELNPPADVSVVPEPTLKTKTVVIIEEPKLEKPAKEKKPRSQAQIEANKKRLEGLNRYRESIKLEKLKAQEELDAQKKRNEELIKKQTEKIKKERPDAEVKIKHTRGSKPGVSKPRPKMPKPKPVVEETSATSDQYSSSESDSDTDSGSESEGTRKYVRKTERRLRTVQKIEQKLKTHGNPYFRNNMSIF
jgi:hypothetical protein